MNQQPPGRSPSAQHPEARLALGALVLGALEPAERAAVEAHVATCAACASELAELAPIPGLLGRLTPAQAAAVDPGTLGTPGTPGDRSDRSDRSAPDELLERILARGHDHERGVARRRRKIGAWTAAVVAAAAAVTWLVAGQTSTPDQPPVVIVQGFDQASDVKGEVTLSPTPNGTQIAVVVSGVRAGEECSLVAWTADGRSEVTSTWQATYRGEATVTGSTSLTLADIAGVTIKTPDGRKLLSLPVPG